MIYGYIRVSTTAQAGTAEDPSASIEEQTKKIQGLAMAYGRGERLELLSPEIGVSGGTPLAERPAGKRLLDSVRKGDTVIVAKMDRLFRDAQDALTTANLWRRQGIHLIIADMGSDPVTGNGTGRLFFTMLAGFAEFERGRIADRMAEGRASKKAKGGATHGNPPFGYRIEGVGKAAMLVEDPTSQAAIQTIKKALAENYSLRGIATLVELDHGIKISHETVRRIRDSDG